MVRTSPHPGTWCGATQNDDQKCTQYEEEKMLYNLSTRLFSQCSGETKYLERRQDYDSDVNINGIGRAKGP
jgi:hypothetical protein